MSAGCKVLCSVMCVSVAGSLAALPNVGTSTVPSGGHEQAYQLYE